MAVDPSLAVIVVHGLPVPQGSKKPFRLPNGRINLAEVGGDRLKQWRHAINDQARRVHGDCSPLDGPVALTVDFRLVKPKSAPKRRRTWPIGQRSGDADKLARAALDALSGVVFFDDAQVVELQVTKDWGDPGVTITYRSLEEGL